MLEFGTIAQVGTPRDLYETPANLFVAQFIGSPAMNIMDCVTSESEFRLEGGRSGAFSGDRPAVKLGVRPEDLEIASEGEGICDGTVDIVEYLGADTFLIVDCGVVGKLTIRIVGQSDFKGGEVIGLRPAGSVHFFDEDGIAIR